MKGSIVHNVRKIAVLRANALGDFIVTLPALQAIRKAYPSAEIVLLGKPWHKEFLVPGRTPVDRVVIIPVSRGLREEPGKEENPAEMEQFFKEMEAESFDIAIHFHGKGVAANPFLRKLRPRITAGLTCREAEQPDRAVEFYYYQSEAVRYLEIARLIGAVPEELEPQVKVFRKDMEEAMAFMGEVSAKPYVVLHPAATDGRRIWPAERFVQLAESLARNGYSIVLTGNEEERPATEQIAAGLSSAPVNACGALSLGGLAGLLEGSSVMVAGDTGPLHLARAVGSRTVGLYWAPNLINWGPLTRRDHRPVISWDLHCPGCNMIPNEPYPFEPLTGECKHNYSFIRNITVEKVLEQVNALLKR